MMKPVSAAILAALATSLVATPVATALAKQRCSASAPANQHGYWSWRFIDGRRCWYEGKPMLSKSSLEWPAQTAAPPDPDEGVAIVPPEKSGDPMDAQARATDSETFEAKWRARIGPARR